MVGIDIWFVDDLISQFNFGWTLNSDWLMIITYFFNFGRKRILISWWHWPASWAVGCNEFWLVDDIDLFYKLWVVLNSDWLMTLTCFLSCGLYWILIGWWHWPASWAVGCTEFWLVDETDLFLSCGLFRIMIGWGHCMTCFLSCGWWLILIGWWHWPVSWALGCTEFWLVDDTDLLLKLWFVLNSDWLMKLTCFLSSG